jgi:hypothetical protein
VAQPAVMPRSRIGSANRVVCVNLVVMSSLPC